jgi:hypothetical protein
VATAAAAKQKNKVAEKGLKATQKAVGKDIKPLQAKAKATGAALAKEKVKVDAIKTKMLSMRTRLEAKRAAVNTAKLNAVITKDKIAAAVGKVKTDLAKAADKRMQQGLAAVAPDPVPSLNPGLNYCALVTVLCLAGRG